MYMLKVIEVVWSVDRGSLLFVRNDAHTENNRSNVVRRLVAPYFFVLGDARVKSIRYG
jgi:hypothetical protein